jgi:LysM repeat protein/uncharacterized protein YvpB
MVLASVLTSGLGQSAAAQQRYRVQPGDTLSSVAEEFGVDPEAILRSSYLADPPNLTAGEVIIIPDPGQSPDEAAEEAAAKVGTSPWASGVYYVVSGDTIETIAANFGVDLAALIEINSLDNPDLLEVGQRLLIPAQIDDATGEAVAVSTSGGSSGYISSGDPNHPWVPTHAQERNLSCEYASAFIATSSFGDGIPESVFWDQIPQKKNPHNGYRGDIDGPWGGYDDYGIYPEPLVPVLNDWGFVGDVFYGMYDPSLLKDHLDAGHPVIVWLALWGDTGQRFNDDGSYTVFAGEHVVVAYGYDAGGVYISDPAKGVYKLMDWDSFINAWGVSDGMSLAVYPA